MSRLEKILKRYSDGDYTTTDTMLAVLQIVLKENVDEVVSSLPDEVRGKLKEFVGYYHPGIRIFNAPAPSMEAVATLRDYFQERA